MLQFTEMFTECFTYFGHKLKLEEIEQVLIVSFQSVDNNSINV